jgi:regulator of protease activity HflC (stomatin/prohibitin superfamily)
MEIVATVVFLLFAVTAISSIKMVSQASVKVIERLGRYHNVAQSGLNIIIPFIDRVRATLDLREQINAVEPQPAITRDNVTMEVDCVVYWQVLDPVKATYEIAELRRALDQLTLSALRNVIGELDLDHTLTSRDLINTKLRATMDQATDRWGVKVTRVELKNIEPPPEIKQTMEKQMTAERDRRARVTEAEGLKAAAILKAEGEKQSAVVAAQGRKEAAILDAEGHAQALQRVAQGEANAIAAIAQGLGGQGDPTRYLIAVKYLDSLRELSRGAGKTVFLPYEATGVLGALGGIKELLTATDGASAPVAPPPRRPLG